MHFYRVTKPLPMWMQPRGARKSTASSSPQFILSHELASLLLCLFFNVGQSTRRLLLQTKANVAPRIRFYCGYLHGSKTASYVQSVAQHRSSLNFSTPCARQTCASECRLAAVAAFSCPLACMNPALSSDTLFLSAPTDRSACSREALSTPRAVRSSSASFNACSRALSFEESSSRREACCSNALRICLTPSHVFLTTKNDQDRTCFVSARWCASRVRVAVPTAAAARKARMTR